MVHFVSVAVLVRGASKEKEKRHPTHHTRKKRRTELDEQMRDDVTFRQVKRLGNEALKSMRDELQGPDNKFWADPPTKFRDLTGKMIL